MFNFYIRHSHMNTNTPQAGQMEALSDDSYDQWVTQYRMREKVHCPPDLRDELNGPMVECRFQTGDGLVTDTRIHRRHDIYLMLMWALCNWKRATRPSKRGFSHW
jgi:hypothetical protein